MKTIAIIPSRYGSSRFPGKPLADIAGKPMIQRVWERVSEVTELDGVCVATDDARIYDCVTGFGGRALMTSDAHRCGTDRLAECARTLGLDDGDTVLNIQGDEPLIRPEMIRDLLGCFEDPSVLMGTLKKEISRREDLENPNVVKVITDLNGDAICFSRFCLPFERCADGVKHYKHIGVYGYKVHFLLEFSRMERTPLERAESLEQLRAIENGFRIRVKETLYDTIGVDTPQQLKEVERIYASL